MPLVSVIIPTYNRRQTVISAVSSVLEQSFSDYELIVVDDGSSDGTQIALEQRFGRRLRLVSQPNQGVSHARNSGAKQASGRWLAFLDSDDRWYPQKLQAQVDFHQKHSRFLISQTQERWIRHGKFVNPRDKHRKPVGHIFPQSLRLCTITPSSVMIAAALLQTIGGFDEDLPACEDYDLWLRLTVSEPVGLIDRTLLTRHGGHPDQLSARFPAMDRFRLYSLLKLLLSDRLDPTQQQQVVAAAAEKRSILKAGLEKRGRDSGPLEALVTAVFERQLTQPEMTRQGRRILLDESGYQ
jgi:glycosyltransferase involved in cell wall biosynthesis